ncbi:MAG: hypothetical protein RR712_03905 [Terrisporobacter sp.]|uniref:hypothetical protein n=1 Tax=Terrisporobacter sp. TaxID=1965305 RepID=UPI002FC870CF
MQTKKIYTICIPIIGLFLIFIGIAFGAEISKIILAPMSIFISYSELPDSLVKASTVTFVVAGIFLLIISLRYIFKFLDSK